ncbi:glycosyltransferase [Iodobacter arcticus]|uniref:Glycosyltransferase n=1 Tax=Iodobacter arcticus TaxID=590593 RepID=A0ABW2QW93_9NEIS
MSSLFKLVDCEYRIVICDNNSDNNSYYEIKNWILSEKEKNSYLNAMDLKCINVLNNESYCIESNDLFLLQTGKNLGFAGGMNVGIRVALEDPRMEYVWILNNDTEVDKNALSALIKHAKSDCRIGICGSTLLYHDQPNVIQAVGGKYNSYLGTIKHILGHRQYSEKLCLSIDVNDMDYIVGAAMLVSKEFIEKIGLMDESYFIYFEELDWATRAKRFDPVFKLGYAAKSIVLHKEGASIGSGSKRNGKRQSFSDTYALRNRIAFSNKFYKNRVFFVKFFILLSSMSRMIKCDFDAALRAFKVVMGRL